MLNKVMLIGNLTRDPEIKTVGDSQVTSFSIATNESYKDKQGNKVDKAEYHNIVAWGKLANIISQYCTKGSKVYIEGKLETQSWEKEGVKQYKTIIKAYTVQFLNKVEKTEQNILDTPTPDVSMEDVPF